MPLNEKILNSCLLVVDDDELQRQLLSSILQHAGFNNIHLAMNGQEGVELARRFRPKLIISDICMPVMDGFELCSRIRQDSDLQNTLILVQSVLRSSDEKARIFKCGADDYITKPADHIELLARINAHLERAMLFDTLDGFHRRLQQELDMAAESLKVLCPSDTSLEFLSESHGIEVQHYETTSSELGGDFWNVLPLSETKVAFYIVDFSGHGVNAALNTFRLHSIMQQSLPNMENPGKYLTDLNFQLKELLSPGQFATMFLGMIDRDNHCVCYASAASPSPILLPPDKPAIILDGQGGLLGAFTDTVYQTQKIEFPRDSRLFLYSDVLIESPDLKGKRMEMQTIINLLGANRGDGFEKLINYLHKYFPKNWPDDLTINMYHYR